MIGSGTADENGKGGGRIVIVAEIFDWYGRIDANGIPLIDSDHQDSIGKSFFIYLINYFVIDGGSGGYIYIEFN